MQTLCQVVPQIQAVATVRNNRGQNPLHVLAENAKHNAPSLLESLLAAVPDYPLAMQDATGNTGEEKHFTSAIYPNSSPVPVAEFRT